MLKHRLIFGTFFSAILVGLIFLDSFASAKWPYGGVGAWGVPPGFFVLLATLVVIPLGLREMRGLLERENVRISLRITIAASILCMVWPWVEQVGESIYQQHATIEANRAMRHVPAGERDVEAEQLREIEASPWYSIGKTFRSVKPHYLVPTILALSLVAAFVMHSRNQRVEGAMANAGGTLLAIVYLGVLPGFYLPICMTHSAWMMLAVVCVVKCADIGAFTAGKSFGRHKLIPWLSPGKTVEGFFGGLVLSGIVCAGLAFWFHAQGGRRWEGISVPALVIGGLVSGMVLGAVGQLGDLLESLLKRDAGVKDSGALPGLGGVLDILDSPLLAAPVAYWLLKIVLPPVGGAM